MQFKRFADDDVLNVKQFMRLDIAYHTRMIYKHIHIKTCLANCFKANKIHLKKRTFLFESEWFA